AVNGDQQPSTAGRDAADVLGREAVAILDPGGKKPADVRAESAKRADHDRRGADAVDVVVAMNRDPGARVDVPLNQRDSAIDPVEGGRRVLLTGVEKRPRRQW